MVLRINYLAIAVFGQLTEPTTQRAHCEPNSSPLTSRDTTADCCVPRVTAVNIRVGRIWSFCCCFGLHDTAVPVLGVSGASPSSVGLLPATATADQKRVGQPAVASFCARHGRE